MLISLSQECLCGMDVLCLECMDIMFEESGCWEEHIGLAELGGSLWLSQFSLSC